MYFYFIYTSKSKCLIFKHPDTRDGRFVVGNALKVSYLLENTLFLLAPFGRVFYIAITTQIGFLKSAKT